MEQLYLITVTDPQYRDELLSQLSGYELVKKYKALNKVFSIILPDEVAETISSDVRVAAIEEKKNYITQNTRTIGHNGNWGLDRIDQRSLPMDGYYTFEKTGRNVDAYIQDTGIRSTHNQFGNRVTHLFSASGLPFEDDNGHGTHVAGTIGGSTYGVAPMVNLFNVRCFTSGGNATNADLLDGFEAILDHHQTKTTGNPSVVNMSFTGNKSTLINNGVQALIDGGVIVCVAAGNYNRDANNYSPASLNDAITVAASGRTDNFASFSNSSTNFTLSGGEVSNSGSVVDIIAPGQDILSAGIGHDNDYAILSGTSMATPHVVGVVALYLEANPSATPADVQSWLITNSTKDVIKLSSEAFNNGTPNRLLYSVFSINPYTLSWITNAGNIGSANEGEAFQTSVVAESINSDNQTRPVSYSLFSGSLPSGITMDGNGVISGTPNSVVENTQYDFTIRATDGVDVIDRDFNIIIQNVNQAPQWQTAAGELGTYREGDLVNIQLVANDPDNDIVTYEKLVGNTPPGISLSQAGILSGTIGEVLSDTYYNFTVKAYDPQGSSANRDFSIHVESYYLPLTWKTDPGSIAVINEGGALTYELLAESRDASGYERPITYTIISGVLPNGLAMNNSGVIQGTASLIANTTTYNFVVQADDGNSTQNRTFSITVNDVNNVPVWQTPVGRLGDYEEGEVISIQLQATDSDGEGLTYNIQNGSLPPDITMDSAGLISGIIGVVSESKPYVFTVRVTDTKASVDRRFEIYVSDINRSPVWVTDFNEEYAGYDHMTTLCEGEQYSFQYEGTDPESDPLMFTVIDGSLPPGLSLSQTGLLHGTVEPVFTSSVEDTNNAIENENVPGTYYNNKRYRFTVGMNDGVNVVPKNFQITVTDVPEGPLPVWLSPEFLGSFTEGNPVYIRLRATAFLINDEDIFYTEDGNFGLPAGLTLSSNGEIYGQLDDLTSDTEFTFRVKAHAFIATVTSSSELPDAGLSSGDGVYYMQAEDTGDYFYNNGDTWEQLDINEFVSVKEFRVLMLNRETQSIPVFSTPEGSLGSIDVYDDSLFKIEASDEIGEDLSYFVVDGELPPGLELHTSGIIMGTVRSNAITTDDYSFTVVAKNRFNTSEPRTFSINVERYYADPEAVGTVVSVYIPIQGDVRRILNDDTKIPKSFLFRDVDPNFGRVKEKHIYLAGGLLFDGLKTFWDGIQGTDASVPSYHNQDWTNPANTNYWYTPNLDYYHPKIFTGDYGWKSVTDENGEVIYDLVYKTVVDPQARAWYLGRVEDGITQTNIEYPQWNVTDNVYNDNELSNIPEAEYLEPQSMRNLRQELIDRFGFNTPPEKLPMHIGNEWTMIIPIAYVKAGLGNDSVVLLKSYETTPTPVRIGVDRWLVFSQNETTWEEQNRPDDTIFDFINPTDDGTSTDYRTLHNRTRFDLDDENGTLLKWYDDPHTHEDPNANVSFEDDGDIVPTIGVSATDDDDGFITDQATIFEDDGTLGD